jgi:hypothetical protein
MRPVCHACHNDFAREKVGPLIDESGGVHEREEGWCFQQRTATQEYPATRLSAAGGVPGRSHDRRQPDFHRQGRNSPIRLIG